MSQQGSQALQHLSVVHGHSSRISYGTEISGSEKEASLMSCLAWYANWCFSPPSGTEREMGRRFHCRGTPYTVPVCSLPPLFSSFLLYLLLLLLLLLFSPPPPVLAG